MSNHKHTLGALEAFLHDVDAGEAELGDIFNILGENELNYILKMAKIGEEACMDDDEWWSRMNGVKERMEKRTKKLEGL